MSVVCQRWKYPYHWPSTALGNVVLMIALNVEASVLVSVPVYELRYPWRFGPHKQVYHKFVTESIDIIWIINVFCAVSNLLYQFIVQFWFHFPSASKSAHLCYLPRDEFCWLLLFVTISSLRPLALYGVGMYSAFCNFAMLTFQKLLYSWKLWLATWKMWHFPSLGRPRSSTYHPYFENQMWGPLSFLHFICCCRCSW